MKREVGCPICGQIISVNFTKEFKQQGGKNKFCPNCHWLLWIPRRGKAEPVPIPVLVSARFKNKI